MVLGETSVTAPVWHESAAAKERMGEVEVISNEFDQFHLLFLGHGGGEGEEPRKRL